MELDAKSRAKLGTIYPDVGRRFLNVFNAIYASVGIGLRISESFRSFEEQNRLYELGRGVSGAKIVTNARGGNSFHNYGCAIDCYWSGDDPYLEKSEQSDILWKKYGETAKRNDFVWGGDFIKLKDMPHIECAYGLSLTDIQDLYKFGQLEAVWSRFDEIRGVPIASEWGLGHNEMKQGD